MTDGIKTTEIQLYSQTYKDLWLKNSWVLSVKPTFHSKILERILVFETHTEKKRDCSKFFCIAASQREISEMSHHTL